MIAWLIYVLGALQFLRLKFPFFTYGFDWDPSDGDMLKAAMRVQKGLPIYGNWADGDIAIVYGPLQPYLLTFISKIGIDPVLASRTLNTFFIISAGALVVSIGRKLGAGWITALLFWSGWILFDHTIYLRPDSMQVFLAILTIWLALTRSAWIWPVACIAILTLLSKQTGAALVPALLIYYWKFEPRRFTALVRALLGIGAVLIGGLELANRGWFIRGCFFQVSAYMPRPQITLDFLWRYFGAMYPLKYSWTLVALGTAAISYLQTSQGPKKQILRLVGIFFALDLLAITTSAEAVGKDPNHFWTHWCLLSILAGFGAEVFSKKIETLGRGLGRGVLAVLVLIMLNGDLVDFMRAPSPSLAEAKERNQKYSQRIADIVAKNPGASWLSERHAMPLARSGVILDQEMCALALAYQQADPAKTPDLFLKRLINGYYHFMQAEGRPTCGRIPLMNSMIQECFQKIADLEGGIFYYPYTLQILEYNGKLPNCRRVAPAFWNGSDRNSPPNPTPDPASHT